MFYLPSPQVFPRTPLNHNGGLESFPVIRVLSIVDSMCLRTHFIFNVLGNTCWRSAGMAGIINIGSAFAVIFWVVEKGATFLISPTAARF